MPIENTNIHKQINVSEFIKTQFHLCSVNLNVQRAKMKGNLSF